MSVGETGIEQKRTWISKKNNDGDDDDSDSD